MKRTVTVKNSLRRGIKSPAGPMTPLPLGVDLSHHNADFDWTQLDASVSFALIKATDGTGSDSQYQVNMLAARNSALKKIGSYHFYRSSHTSTEQYNAIIQTADIRPNDFPISIDFENVTPTQTDPGQTLTVDDIPILADLVRQLYKNFGVYPMIYTNNAVWTSIGSPAASDEIKFGLCPLWISHWTTATAPTYPAPWISWDIWQYTDSGQAGGATVDMNRYNGSLDAMVSRRATKRHRKPKARTDFISIQGSDSALSGSKFVLTIWVDGSMVWTAGEPGSTSNIFTTKSGVWMRAANIVTLFQKDATTRVAQLSPLIPDKAKPNDKGSGHEFETAVDISWVVIG